MVHDPISVLDALMIALSGIVIVFLMLALLWGVIAVISRVMGVLEKHTAHPASVECGGSGGCGSGSSTGTGSAGQAGRRQRGGGGLRYGYRQPRNGHSARSACI
ncbi:MAG: OadG family protein [Butyricicoccus sp.]